MDDLLIDCPDYLKVWDEVEPMLQMALDKTGGEYDNSDIKTLLSNREALLWTVGTQDRIHAVFVTQIHIYPSKRIGVVMLGAGDGLKFWRDIIHVFTRYFKDEGCDYFDIIGRKGWLKTYQDDGFYEQYVTIRKAL